MVRLLINKKDKIKLESNLSQLENDLNKVFEKYGFYFDGHSSSSEGDFDMFWYPKESLDNE